MNYVIGSTPAKKDLPQSRRGDFQWILPFVDVAEDGTETDTDLTDCDFSMTILELDGTTTKKVLIVSDGITVVGNTVTVEISNAEFENWTPGCQYPYFFIYVNASNFTKCLFEGKFILS